MRMFKWARWLAPQMTIGLDLARMGSGGQNGGIKPWLFQLVRDTRNLGRGVRFRFFVSSGLVSEIRSLCGPRDCYCCVAESEGVSWSSLAANRRLLLRRSPDVQVAGSDQIDVLVATFGYSTLLIPGVPFVPLVVDLLHRDLPEHLPPEEVAFRETCLRESVTNADFVLTISQFVAKRLQEVFGINKERCGVIYNATHERLPKLQLATSSMARPYFLFPANYWPHKNHEGLLVAYRQYLAHAGSNAWDLMFTGAENERAVELRQISTSLRVTDRVHFLGHLDDAAFAQLWMRAGALVYPSLYEGFGIPLLEAMHFRVPIICSGAASLPEIAGDAALLFDPRKPADIADKLGQIASDEPLRKQLCKRGARRLESFNGAQEARRFVEYLTSVARAKRR